MNTGSSRDNLMEIRISPAVVIVVLVLVAAILVGLYFMVVARPQAGASVEAAALAPGPALATGVLALLASVQPAGTTAAATATPRGSSSRPGTREKAASL